MRFTLAVSALLALSSCTGVLAGHKKKVPVVKTLCPAGETACPIAGSTTYEDALKHHQTTKGEVAGVMAGFGGYECVNTMEALESCGGCASTSEGQDCTKIRGSSGVGCSEGKCVIFSCQPGWRVSMDGEKCVRSRSTDRPSHKSKAGGHNHGRMQFEVKKPTPVPAGGVIDSSVTAST
ncbi:hypothetical protein JCM8547_006220 [Rhodosporidiobolus lusitaniae]